MITGGAGATVFYNLRQRHPTLDMPVIDYDLALLFQPMLMLGISIGVAFNVIFPDWMLTTLLIVVFIGLSVNAFLKGVQTWKKETIIMKSNKYQPTKEKSSGKCRLLLLVFPCSTPILSNKIQVSVIDNIYWKELGLLVTVWILILALQIGKNYITNCSAMYWVLNLIAGPIYKGQRVISSKGDQQTRLSERQIILYCTCGILAGIICGLLGLGGGFILGPLFIGLGIPPQVLSSATSTFAMTFSASMSVVEYYLLKRFPIPYALYFVAVATAAALSGQHLVRKLIAILGRTSLIIFILALTVFVSGVGIANFNIKRVEKKEYMGFEDLCSYRVRN
uniref:Uncharacterized protein n=1 Tax=Cajanus cajan TaxID=3821 RepID=A0A151U9Y0_CAJCA|nr:hypothetical protein KK1_020355 [Cajanus cajan]